MARARPPVVSVSPTLAARVRELEPSWSWSQARAFIESGRVWLDGECVRDGAKRVAEGVSIELRKEAAKRLEGVLESSRILFVDEHIVVVNKPAHVNTVSFEHTGPLRERDTLVDRVRARLSRIEKARGARVKDTVVGVVQRLDRETTGVMVFARTLRAKAGLEEQIRGHTAIREYRALVHGVPRVGTIESMILEDRGDGLRGSFGTRAEHGRHPPKDAKRSVTHVVSVQPRQDGKNSLVSCRIETGRQHQIRIHLSEQGHPLLGERVYGRDYVRNGGTMLEAPRVMLHAFSLAFAHPISGEQVSFSVAADEF